MSSSRTTPAASGNRVWVIVLIVLGVLFAVVAVIYAVEPAGKIPAFFPGYAAGSTHVHVKHALGAGTLAVISWIAAWMVSGRRARR